MQKRKKYAWSLGNSQNTSNIQFVCSVCDQKCVYMWSLLKVYLKFAEFCIWKWSPYKIYALLRPFAGSSPKISILLDSSDLDGYKIGSIIRMTEKYYHLFRHRHQKVFTSNFCKNGTRLSACKILGNFLNFNNGKYLLL